MAQKTSQSSEGVTRSREGREDRESFYLELRKSGTCSRQIFSMADLQSSPRPLFPSESSVLKIPISDFRFLIS
jgi:hypothetical protein